MFSPESRSDCFFSFFSFLRIFQKENHLLLRFTDDDSLTLEFIWFSGWIVLTVLHLKVEPDNKLSENLILVFLHYFSDRLNSSSRSDCPLLLRRVSLSSWTFPSFLDPSLTCIQSAAGGAPGSSFTLLCRSATPPALRRTSEQDG